MTQWAALPQRLSKLLPLLASDKPGEVVAAAAAIGRTLEAAGHDWHDLTAAITDGLKAEKPQRTDHLAMIRAVTSADLDLSPWEQSFVVGAMQRLRRQGSLTPKRAETLAELYARAA